MNIGSPFTSVGEMSKQMIQINQIIEMVWGCQIIALVSRKLSELSPKQRYTFLQKISISLFFVLSLNPMTTFIFIMILWIGCMLLTSCRKVNLFLVVQVVFFVLAAHLCQNCTVIHNSSIKFAKTEYEKNLPKHMNDYFCEKELRCYIDYITKNIS